MHDLGGGGGIVRIRIANSFSSSLLSTSLLIRVRQGFREHEDPKRLHVEVEEREGAGRAMCTKNPRRLFVTRSAILFGLERHVHVNRRSSRALRTPRRKNNGWYCW